jgi:nucleoside-diphosphate-sugar epimerase
VIGGGGYIGSALIPKLLDRGCRVRVLDLFLYGQSVLSKYSSHPNLEIVEADFRQIDAVVAAMRDANAVVHLGGLVGDPSCELDQQLTVEINLMATKAIAEVAKGAGVGRFVFASTCSVYGASDEILDERSALHPVSLYARSKICSERVLLDSGLRSISPVILRFGTIFGLSERTRFDLVVNLLVAKAVTEGRITLFGGGQWRPFLHVRDAASSIVRSLEAPVGRVRGQVFNVGRDDMNYRLVEVAESIRRQVPAAEVVDFGADSDRRNYRVNFKKLRTILDFQPEHGIDEGIREVIDAFKLGLVSNYADARYSNVKYLADHNMASLRHNRGWERELLDGIERISEEDVSRTSARILDRVSRAAGRA